MCMVSVSVCIYLKTQGFNTRVCCCCCFKQLQRNSVCKLAVALLEQPSLANMNPCSYVFIHIFFSGNGFKLIFKCHFLCCFSVALILNTCACGLLWGHEVSCHVVKSRQEVNLKKENIQRNPWTQHDVIKRTTNAAPFSIPDTLLSCQEGSMIDR